MSSAILFAAIVAIWIGALVPRWLRHDHAYDGHLRLRRFSRQPEADQQDGDTNARAGFSQGGRPRYTSFGDHEDPREDHAQAGRAGRDRGAALSGYNSMSLKYDAAYVPVARNGNTGDMAQRYETDEAPAAVRSYGWSADEYLRHEREYLRRQRTSQRALHDDGRGPAEGREQSGRARRLPPQHDERPQHGGRSDSGPDHEEQRPGNRAQFPAGNRATADSERRARMVRGRRRMLWMLVILTAAAAGLAYLRLAAWWIVIPPVALLGGYLLVLREAARADAEARERLAVQARYAWEAEARREAEAEAAPGRTTGTSVPTALARDSAETDPRAESIDISERVGNELYDQYADAQLRAVGD